MGGSMPFQGNDLLGGERSGLQTSDQSEERLHSKNAEVCISFHLGLK